MDTFETSPSELIRDWPAAIRPTSRLRALGAEALKDEELLTIALRLRSLKPAEKLLTSHRIKNLLALPLARLEKLPGVGEKAAASMIAVAELTRRAEKISDTAAITLQTVQDVAAQSLEYRDKKKEHLLAFFMNARHQLIAREIISIGTLTASLAHPREIFAPAIGKAAAGVILVHNHPSGDPSPSDEDVRLTQRINQAGRILGIDLLDHLIIAEHGTYSFKTAGAL